MVFWRNSSRVGQGDDGVVDRRKIRLFLCICFEEGTSSCFGDILDMEGEVEGNGKNGYRIFGFYIWLDGDFIY